MYNLAVDSLQIEDYKTVIFYLEKALTLNPLDVHTNQLLGTAYLKAQDSGKSVFYLSRAVDLTSWQQPLI